MSEQEGRVPTDIGSREYATKVGELLDIANDLKHLSRDTKAAADYFDKLGTQTETDLRSVIWTQEKTIGSYWETILTLRKHRDRLKDAVRLAETRASNAENEQRKAERLTKNMSLLLHALLGKNWLERIRNEKELLLDAGWDYDEPWEEELGRHCWEERQYDEGGN